MFDRTLRVATVIRCTALVLGILTEEVWGLERLEPPFGCYLGVYLGVDIPNQEVATPIDSFLVHAEKAHAIYHRFLPWDAPFPRVWAESVAERGAAPMISYGMRDSIGMDTAYNLQDMVFMAFVRAMKQFGRPVFLRMGWEMNGRDSWHPWGQCARHFVPAFKRAARIIHDSCPNVAMVWCPNYGGGYPWGGRNEGDAYTVYYPYDDSFAYVDWVGLDFYHNVFWGNQYTPLAVILGRPESSVIHFYRHFCDSLGKPLLFGETSTLEATRNNQTGTLQRWWLATLYDSTNLSQTWPKLKASTWFHVLKKEEMGGIYDWVDWRITDSGFVVYREAIRSRYFLSEPDTGGMTGYGENHPETGSDRLTVIPTPAGLLVKCCLQQPRPWRIAIHNISGRLIFTSLFDTGTRKDNTVFIPYTAIGGNSGVLFLTLTGAHGRRIGKALAVH